MAWDSSAGRFHRASGDLWPEPVVIASMILGPVAAAIAWSGVS